MSAPWLDDGDVRLYAGDALERAAPATLTPRRRVVMTLREHLEAQASEGCIYGGACDHPDPMQCCPGCRARSRARSMLTILGASQRDHEHTPEPSGHRGDYRLVRDPEPSA